MEKSRQTKELLANQFHRLMLSRDFDKITIRQITDEAGVIRPTFYYHFQDKYDVLEFILCRDIIEPLRCALGKGDLRQALRMSFRALEEDRHFYARAFRVTGQNSFEEMLIGHLENLWLEGLEEYDLEPLGNRLLSKETLAMYYSLGLANVIKSWITDHSEEASAEEMSDAYEYLMSHSILDIVQQKADADARPEEPSEGSHGPLH